MARSSLIGLVGALACVASGCGANNSGDPIRQARAIADPMPDHAHADVYCSPRSVDDPVENCSVLLRAEGEVSDGQVVAWWYRTARAIERSPGPVRNDNKTFYFVDVGPCRPGSPHWAAVGWRCPGDGSLSTPQRRARMVAREPFGAHPLAEESAEQGKCRLGPYV